MDRNTVFFDTVSVSQLIESGTLHGLTLSKDNDTPIDNLKIWEKRLPFP